MTAMSKKERIEYARSLLDANYIVRLYRKMNEAKQKEIEKKLCFKCGKKKSLTRFYKYESSGNKHTFWCKKCIDYYIENISVGAN